MNAQLIKQSSYSFNDLAFINLSLFKEGNYVVSKMSINDIFRGKILGWIPGLLVQPTMQCSQT